MENDADAGTCDVNETGLIAALTGLPSRSSAYVAVNILLSADPPKNLLIVGARGLSFFRVLA